MKKTFLVFGIFAGLSSAGQNKDILDIQKLIQERQAKESGAEQKYKLIAPLIKPSSQLSYTEPYILPNGDRVVYGQLDRMPIVQPDMRNFTIMPNRNVNMDEFRTMPNAARKQFFADGPNNIMDQLAPSPILEKLLKNSGK